MSEVTSKPRPRAWIELQRVAISALSETAKPPAPPAQLRFLVGGEAMEQYSRMLHFLKKSKRGGRFVDKCLRKGAMAVLVESKVGLCLLFVFVLCCEIEIGIQIKQSERSLTVIM